MPDYGWFLITIGVAAAGGLLAIRLKIPLGGIIGALTGVAALNLLSGGHAVFYSPLKVAMQITIGAVSGSRIGFRELKNMRRVLLPAAIIYPLYFLMAFLFGMIIFRVSPLDAITSLLIACPGGASDIALIAEDFGADIAYTGILHVIRVVFCCVVLPQVFLFIIHEKERRSGTSENSETGNHIPAAEAEKTGVKAGGRMTGLVIAAAAGGILFRILGVTSGAIIGSLLFSVVYSCVVGKCTLPKWVRKIQLIVTGAYVGATVTREVVAGLKMLTVPVLVLILEIVTATALLSFLVYKTKRLDMPTILPSCSPGGIAEMILLADEIGGDVSTVAVIQAFRIVFVVTLFPSLLSILLKVVM